MDIHGFFYNIMTYIYFIKSANKVKIGYTKNVRKRKKYIQSHCSEKCELLVLIPGDRKLEKEIHQHFKKYKSHGEWFLLGEDLKNYIKRLQQYYWLD